MLCQESPSRLYDLIRYGAKLATDSEGRLIQTAARSGGQSKRRVVAVGDFIGFVMQRSLMKQAILSGATFMDETVVFRLLADGDDAVRGALLYDLRARKPIVVDAQAVILCTGGASAMFPATTNPPDATGEGYLLALDAGAALSDLEMVQFHPTALCWPESAKGLLVTEAARGIGGELVNAERERFMARYDPTRLELAPRDVVSRAISAEVAEGRGSPHGGVWLDLRRASAAAIEERLVNTRRLVAFHHGIDIAAAPIEVGPSAHHWMGGVVPQDLETMRAVDGLYVAGEASWGVHGANRLGGNALAETQVFGARAGRGALEAIRTAGARSPASDLALREFSSLMRGSGDRRVSGIRQRIRQLMGEHLGVRRTAAGLEAADRALDECRAEFGRRRAPQGYFGVVATIECAAMLRLARLLTRSARRRAESRGAHYRAECPDEQPVPANTVVRTEHGQVELVPTR